MSIMFNKLNLYTKLRRETTQMRKTHSDNRDRIGEMRLQVKGCWQAPGAPPKCAVCYLDHISNLNFWGRQFERYEQGSKYLIITKHQRWGQGNLELVVTSQTSIWFQGLRVSRSKHNRDGETQIEGENSFWLPQENTHTRTRACTRVCTYTQWFSEEC